jgi:transcriptional regulator with XRE-family HTH domain
VNVTGVTKWAQLRRLPAFLRRKREKMGCSKNQLARALDLPDPMVLRFESGEFAAPRPHKLARLARLLDSPRCGEWNTRSQTRTAVL